MAGFMTWLRRQDEREDSVGALAREVIREDPARDVWLYEDWRERLMVRDDGGWRNDALARATAEWGVTIGIPMRRPAHVGDGIPAARQRSDAAIEATKEPASPQERKASWRRPAEDGLPAVFGIRAPTT